MDPVDEAIEESRARCIFCCYTHEASEFESDPEICPACGKADWVEQERTWG
jgi:hypothetical protein